MVKKKVKKYCAPVLLLILAIFMCMVQSESTMLPFSVQVTSDTQSENIALWESEAEDYYVFLPAYAQPDQVEIRLHTSNSVSINGIILKDGMSCAAFLPQESYDLVYSVRGKDVQKTVTFLYSENVASMYINTKSESMDYIHQEKGNEESGNMRLYANTGVLDNAVSLTIKGRGNTSWRNSEKKPYSISLDEEANLLGMGQASNWILLANSDDYSNMRNKIVLDFAAEMGLPYSSKSEWIDLYLNGRYMGLYLLCERNEVHTQRVDIAHENSFLVSLENEYRMQNQSIPYVSTSLDKHLRIHYCGGQTDSAKEKLSSVWQSVENAITNKNNVDPVTQKSVEELIDIESWAAKYLIEEIFGNIDAANLSQYFYYDGNQYNGKIVAGPVWDYDHSLGNKSQWQLTIENGLFANREIIEEGFTTPWFFYLYEKTFFYDEVCNIYQELCLPILEKLVDDRIYVYLEEIKVPSNLNGIRWNLNETDVVREVEYIRDVLCNRIDFLTSIWVNKTPYHVVKARNGFEGYYGYYAVFEGDTMPELPIFEDTERAAFLGWYNIDGDTLVEIDKSITSDVEIYAKWEEKTSSSIKQVLKLMPVAVIAVMAVLLLSVEVRRWRK